jgi:hypothetical protein
MVLALIFGRSFNSDKEQKLTAVSIFAETSTNSNGVLVNVVAH